jgi:hypothetical protein
MGVEGGLALSVFLIGCVAISSLSARNGTSPAPYIYRSRGGHCFQWSAKKIWNGSYLSWAKYRRLQGMTELPDILESDSFPDA